jgi:hypothetical protein
VFDIAYNVRMGYSLEEDIESAEKRLEFLKAVMEKYPDVQRIEVGGRTLYVSRKADKDCTDVSMFESDRHQVFAPYVKFAGGHVYGGEPFLWPMVWTVLDEMRKKHPPMYDWIVQFVLKH